MLAKKCFFRLLILCVIPVISSTAQNNQNEIKGVVLSAKDSIPLIGVSVYFDGTSIGVSTDQKGRFELNFEAGINSPMVISYVGYEPVIVDNYATYKGLVPVIYLHEKPEELEAVYLEDDPWTRKKKLAVFRREFLGKTEATIHCKIKNEEVLKLRYFPSSQTLIAYADSPLIIENKYLGYKVYYTLQEFEAEFITNLQGLRLTNRVYYEGVCFFNELRKKASKKIIKNRNISYLGSSLHFMRSLAAHNLEENGFKIFYNSWQVPAYKYFEMKKTTDFTKVTLLVDQVSVLYQDFEQSEFMTKDSFFIDTFGNHSPPNVIIFGGHISMSGVSELLPLDYGIH
ncbi:CarboxypepD_reg-like domain-containing protein [Zhouia amylolytica]|uniref:CarboxypepD_reg-like domain-containing protein n=1 Tax=Zhouia amylolytica TaxID=376730 RepID=A0A1I6PN13_9FLAO|nr:carboxypeptidase-like regulatory domain-containing protein [Zhouia amylolytica]SFS41601.1 CarboxypepD_reg-like domain-containing protein [Zhouia amylolytica]